MSILKGIGITIGSIAALFAISWGLGLFNLNYEQYFGVRQANIQHQIFKNSTPYVEGAAQDLARYKYQLSQTKDPQARKAIIQVVLQQYGNLDPSKLESPDLQEFLQSIQTGSFQ